MSNPSMLAYQMEQMAGRNWQNEPDRWKDPVQEWPTSLIEDDLPTSEEYVEPPTQDLAATVFGMDTVNSRDLFSPEFLQQLLILHRVWIWDGAPGALRMGDARTGEPVELLEGKVRYLPEPSQWVHLEQELDPLPLRTVSQWARRGLMSLTLAEAEHLGLIWGKVEAMVNLVALNIETARELTPQEDAGVGFTRWRRLLYQGRAGKMSEQRVQTMGELKTILGL